MSKKPIVSIIIPVYHEWSQTLLCLRSLFRHTPIPFEVILVHNGSDKVPEKVKNHRSILLIQNKINYGNAAAINQGLACSKGEYLIWLSSDTLPSYRWITQMLAIFKQDASVGMVGPMSNKALPEQRFLIPFKKVSQIHRFTNQFNHSNPKRWKECDRLSGFCLVYPRKVFEEVGFLDERFGLFVYEDYDYCLRVKQKGYRLMLAGDTYAHRFGRKNIRPLGPRDYQKIVQQNKKYFLYKWDDIQSE
jgi:GT2 family glycosyltransferase